MLFSFMHDKPNKIAKFEALFSKYGKQLLFYIKKLVYDKSAAEDVLQEAFIQVYKNLEKIEDTDSIRAKNYLYAITRNMAFEFNRKTKSMETVTKGYDESIIMLDDMQFMKSISNASIGEQLDEALGQLEANDREILSLKYGLELDDCEIAEILRIKKDAVRQRLSRAKKRLAAIIEGTRKGD